jgi:ketosteroid isomerase-like protein
MSRENVEVVRRIYADWEKGDMRAGVELFDSDIVFASFMPDSTERITVRGPEGVETFMREFLAQWRDYRLFGEKFRQVGTNKVFVEGHQTATGRESGVAVEDEAFSIWTFRGGRVVNLLFDRDRHRALEAVELRE